MTIPSSRDHRHRNGLESLDVCLHSGAPDITRLVKFGRLTGLMLCQWLKRQTVLVAAYVLTNVLTNVAYLYNRTFGAAPRWRADFFRGFLKGFKRGKCHGCYRSCLLRATGSRSTLKQRGTDYFLLQRFFTFPSIWRFWRSWHKFMKNPVLVSAPRCFEMVWFFLIFFISFKGPSSHLLVH